MDTVKLNIYIVILWNHSFRPPVVTDMRIQVDPLGYASQVIQVRRVSPLRFVAVKYFFIHTTTVPNIDILVHVDEVSIIENTPSRIDCLVMSLQLFKLCRCERSTTFP